MLTSPPSATPATFRRPGSRAFTLVELIVVMVVIVLIIGIAAPVVTSVKNSGDVTAAVYDIKGILEQARAYAMANNTYVYAGVEEADASQPRSGTQQSGANKYGRVIIAVVATKDGTQGFSTSSLQNWTTAYPTFAKNLVVVGKPLVFENLHLPDLGKPPVSGAMLRPDVSTGNSTSMSYALGSSQCISATPFDYPVGFALGTGQYSFAKVIQFDPQGVARIQSTTSPSTIAAYLETGLQQTHGAAVSALPTSPTSGNIAAIQIDGITGAVRIYRP